MTITCGTCERFTTGAHPGTTNEKSLYVATSMARLGLGRCLVGPHYRFTSPTRPHSCARYVPGTPKT